MNDENNEKHAERDTALSDDVLRKIGRNVLLFQHIEASLKFLLINHRVEGTTVDAAKNQQERIEKYQNKTMGILVGHFKDDILSDAGGPVVDPKEVTQPRITSTFTISGDSDFYESQRSNMKLMVDERNNLIHHFLPRWQPDSIEHMRAAASYLDQQHEKMMPMAEHLKGVEKSMQETRQMMASLFASEEGARQLELLWLYGSPLITLLHEVAAQKPRPDGWAYLTTAGHLARIHQPNAVKNIEQDYGYATLKQLVAGSGFFDLLDEFLPNGNFRTLYRVKS